MGGWAAFALVLALVGSGCSIQVNFGLPGPNGPVSGDPSAGGAESEARAEWEGLYPAYQLMPGGRRWGYIDRTGSFVIAPQFESAASFEPNGLALVSQGETSGVINTKGELVYSGTDIYSAVAAGSVMILDSGDKSVMLDAAGSVLFEADWISDEFSDGLAPFEWDGLYGYVDSKGSIVIEPVFKEAEPFSDGQAIVKLADGQYAIINTAGQQVRQLGYDDVADLDEGMYAYRDSATGLWGYKSLAGDVVIPSQFVYASPFRDGQAVVWVGDGWISSLRGVIDRQGNFVIPAEYGSISYLGDGFYAVAQETEGLGQGLFMPDAIFNAEGRQLTDFRFYEASVTPYGISVSDGKETYFLNRNGERDSSLPSAEGRGRMYALHDLIAVEVDGSLRYVTPDGKTVWEPSDSMPLVGGGEIREQKLRKGPFVLIRYPQVEGLPNREVQDRINERLRMAFGWTPPSEEEGNWGSTLDVNYTVEQIGRILVVQLDGYWYPAGAAHGMPSKEYFHFDLDTGAEYGLRDLFKPGSAYQARLEKLVSERILAERPDLDTTEPSVAPDHYFAVTVEGLVLYWYPYEIGPYSSGFPTFLIPWDDVSDLIDRDGTFWRGLGL